MFGSAEDMSTVRVRDDWRPGIEQRSSLEGRQVKCLTADEGHVWMRCYDRLPPAGAAAAGRKPFQPLPGMRRHRRPFGLSTQRTLHYHLFRCDRGHRAKTKTMMGGITREAVRAATRDEGTLLQEQKGQLEARARQLEADLAELQVLRERLVSEAQMRIDQERRRAEQAEVAAEPLRRRAEFAEAELMNVWARGQPTTGYGTR